MSQPDVIKGKTVADEVEQNAVESDLVAQLYSQAYPLTFGFPLGTFLIAYFLSSRVPLFDLLLWCFVIASISLVRALLTKSFYRAARPLDTRAWTRRYALLEVAAGSAAGMSGAFFSHLSFGFQALLVFVVAVQAAGGASLLAPSFKVYMGFVLPGILLIAFWLWQQGEEARIISTLLPVYLVLMLMLAWRIHQALRRSYGLQRRVMGLNDELIQARDETQAANDELTRLNLNLERRVLARTRDIRREMEQRKRLEQEMHQLQKLEAVGRLAAGIAHEVNTPAQYIGDNVHFLQEAFSDLQNLQAKQSQVLRSADASSALGADLQRLREYEQDIDLSELLQEIPRAIDQSLDGVERISKIVHAMKEFSHPGSGQREYTDINRALRHTAEVCRNEWKRLAEVDFDLQTDMQPVAVYPGELNQVFLNLMVNAAHAIAARQGAKQEKGRILIRSSLKGNTLEIQFEDNGCGMDEEVKQRIFEPFFTTKGLGKGTGQGLAITHSIVVDRHGGQIEVTSAPDQGARFTLRLPV